MSWLTRYEEVRQKKLNSWSAHMAWGIVFSIVLGDKIPPGLALAASAAIGLAWEWPVALLVGWKSSGIDLLTWWLGSIAGFAWLLVR